MGLPQPGRSDWEVKQVAETETDKEEEEEGQPSRARLISSKKQRPGAGTRGGSEESQEAARWLAGAESHRCAADETTESDLLLCGMADQTR